MAATCESFHITIALIIGPIRANLERIKITDLRANYEELFALDEKGFIQMNNSDANELFEVVRACIFFYEFQLY